MPVILATQEAEIRRIAVQNQPGQIVCKPSLQTSQKRSGGVAQGVSPEFSTSRKKKKKWTKEQRWNGTEGPW
jgi:hypothetical protein